MSWVQDAPSKGETFFSSTRHLIERTPVQYMYKRVRQTNCAAPILNWEINTPQCNSLISSNHPLWQQHKGAKFITTCLLPLLSHTSTLLFHHSSDTLTPDHVCVKSCLFSKLYVDSFFQTLAHWEHLYLCLIIACLQKYKTVIRQVESLA